MTPGPWLQLCALLEPQREAARAQVLGLHLKLYFLGSVGLNHQICFQIPPKPNLPLLT